MGEERDADQGFILGSLSQRSNQNKIPDRPGVEHHLQRQGGKGGKMGERGEKWGNVGDGAKGGQRG